MNNVNLMGRIINDVEDDSFEVKEVGKTVMVRATVLVAQDFKNRDGEYGSDLIPIEIWGEGANHFKKFWKKNKPIVLENGKITTGSYIDKNTDEKKYTWAVKFFSYPKFTLTDNTRDDDEPKKKSSTKSRKQETEDDEETDDEAPTSTFRRRKRS